MSAPIRFHSVAVLSGGAVAALVLAGCGVLGDAGDAGDPDDPGSSASSTPHASAAATTPAGTATPSPARQARPAGFTFPIKARTSFGRAHHHYAATDIFAKCGATVVAPTDGVISEVSRHDTWDRKINEGASRGGVSFSMVGAEGVRYYGSHLQSIGADIRPGATVVAGDVIGEVGHTGDAADVPCHLHFGISPDCGTGDWWIRRGRVSPYPFLKAWQQDENRSPATAVADWKAEHGCSKTPPKAY